MEAAAWTDGLLLERAVSGSRIIRSGCAWDAPRRSVTSLCPVQADKQSFSSELEPARGRPPTKVRLRIYTRPNLSRDQKLPRPLLMAVICY